MKNFYKILAGCFFVLPLVLAFNFMPARALQVVYPKTQSTQISAASTFIIGSTAPDAKLKINDIDVKVHDNGSFVQVVPLNDGVNEIKIDSQDSKEHNTMTYIINRVPQKVPESMQAALEEFAPDEFIYAAVLKDNTPLRAQPDEYAKRLTHMGKDTVLMINGKKGDYYRVSLTPTENAWVKSDCIVKYSAINEKMLATASKVSLSEDNLYNFEYGIV